MLASMSRLEDDGEVGSRFKAGIDGESGRKADREGRGRVQGGYAGRTSQGRMINVSGQISKP